MSVTITSAALPTTGSRVPDQHTGLYVIEGQRSTSAPVDLYQGVDFEVMCAPQRQPLGQGKYRCARDHAAHKEKAEGCVLGGGKVFSRKADVDRHIKAFIVGKQWGCPEAGCSHKSVQKTHMESHLAKEHVNDGDRRRFRCLKCPDSWETRDPSAFHRHFDAKHPEVCNKLRTHGKKRAMAITPPKEGAEVRTTQRGPCNKRRRDEDPEEEHEDTEGPREKRSRIEGPAPAGYEAVRPIGQMAPSAPTMSAPLPALLSGEGMELLQAYSALAGTGAGVTEDGAPQWVDPSQVAAQWQSPNDSGYESGIVEDPELPSNMEPLFGGAIEPLFGGELEPLFGEDWLLGDDLIDPELFG